MQVLEIPSQFLEHFPTTLATNHLVAKHIETGKPFSKELISKIGKVEDYFLAYKWIRQCVFSLFDLELHSKNALKYATKKGLGDKFYKTLSKKYIGIQGTKNSSTFSNFPHIVGGYESKYNSYVISRVYAEDVWNEFIKKGKTKEYKLLMETGNKEKEMEILTKFLGRHPSNTAFINFLKNH